MSFHFERHCYTGKAVVWKPVHFACEVDFLHIASTAVGSTFSHQDRLGKGTALQ